MIPFLRKQFNEQFTPEKYRAFLRRIDDISGTHVYFRLSETPCFFPKEMLDRMARDGKQLIRQLVDDPTYLAKSDEAVPAENKAQMSRRLRCLCRWISGWCGMRMASCIRSLWSCRPSLPSMRIRDRWRRRTSMCMGCGRRAGSSPALRARSE